MPNRQILLVVATEFSQQPLRASTGLDRVCLSGGTFQNVHLLERTVEDLRPRGFGVFLHSMVPANGGGLALGQAPIVIPLLHGSN